MVALIPPQTVMTPGGAANDLQTHGLDALGLTVPNVSPVWAANGPGAYSQSSLSLQLTGLKAPFRAGGQIRMTLRFRDAKGGERIQDVTVPVALAAPAHGH